MVHTMIGENRRRGNGLFTPLVVDETTPTTFLRYPTIQFPTDESSITEGWRGFIGDEEFREEMRG